MGQEHSRSQAGNNSPSLLRFQHSEGRQRGNAAALIADRLGCGGAGLGAGPLLGAETTGALPLGPAGLRTSQSSAGAGGLSLPAQPQDSLSMLQAHITGGALPGRSREPRLPQPTNRRGSNRQLWVGKTSLAREGSTGKTLKPCYKPTKWRQSCSNPCTYTSGCWEGTGARK